MFSYFLYMIKLVIYKICNTITKLLSYFRICLSNINKMLGVNIRIITTQLNSKDDKDTLNFVKMIDINNPNVVIDRVYLILFDGLVKLKVAKIIKL